MNFELIFWVNYNLHSHLCFGQNLSCLTVHWNLTFYLPKVWPKFKLSICDLKSHDVSVPWDFFIYFFILLDLVFFSFFCGFGGKKHKSEAKSYI